MWGSPVTRAAVIGFAGLVGLTSIRPVRRGAAIGVIRTGLLVGQKTTSLKATVSQSTTNLRQAVGRRISGLRTGMADILAEARATNGSGEHVSATDGAETEQSEAELTAT